MALGIVFAKLLILLHFHETVHTEVDLSDVEGFCYFFHYLDCSVTRFGPFLVHEMPIGPFFLALARSVTRFGPSFSTQGANLTTHLVLVRGAHDVEEEVDVAPVEAGHAVEHDDLAVGLVRLLEKALLERALLLHGRERLLVVVVGQDALAVVVQDGDALHRVQGRGLRKEVRRELINNMP